MTLFCLLTRVLEIDLYIVWVFSYINSKKNLTNKIVLVRNKMAWELRWHVSYPRNKKIWELTRISARDLLLLYSIWSILSNRHRPSHKIIQLHHAWLIPFSVLLVLLFMLENTISNSCFFVSHQLEFKQTNQFHFFRIFRTKIYFIILFYTIWVHWTCINANIFQFSIK